jgi:hypothetical protein
LVHPHVRILRSVLLKGSLVTAGARVGGLLAHLLDLRVGLVRFLALYHVVYTTGRGHKTFSLVLLLGLLMECLLLELRRLFL